MPLKAAIQATAIGALVAFLALNAFGLWVVLHPFGTTAERSIWLAPLLALLSWVPFAAPGAFLITRLQPHRPMGPTTGAALTAAGLVVATSAYYLPQSGLRDIVTATWVHMLAPVALFPAFAAFLAKRPPNHPPNGSPSYVQD